MNVEPLIWILVGEAALLGLIIAVVSMIRGGRRTRRQMERLDGLLDKLNRDDPRHLQQVLVKRFGLSGQHAVTLSKELRSWQKALLGEFCTQVLAPDAASGDSGRLGLATALRGAYDDDDLDDALPPPADALGLDDELAIPSRKVQPRVARPAESHDSAESVALDDGFPVDELLSNGVARETSDDAETLTFDEQWETQTESASVGEDPANPAGEAGDEKAA